MPTEASLTASERRRPGWGPRRRGPVRVASGSGGGRGGGGGGGGGPAHARRNRAAAVAIAGFAVLLVALVLALRDGGEPGPATGAAALVPADALAYVHVSTDGSRPAVRSAVRLEARLPNHLLLEAAVLGRLGAIAGGGTTVDFATDIRPWLGREAAFALVGTPGSSAGSLIVLDVARRARALRFVEGAAAVAAGRYRGAALYRYPNRTELAFAGHYLVIGQDAAVRASVDAYDGRAPSLAGSRPYTEAATGERSGRVLDAYISAAGVRQVLLARTGVAASLGTLLAAQGAAGTTVSVSAVAGGLRVRVHGAPVVAAGAGGAAGAGMRDFRPTLAGLVPSHSILMLDVPRLDRAAPAVLAAAAQAGIGAGVAPLLARLGGALAAEGVDVTSVMSIFDREGVVAIGPSHSLLLIARAASQSGAARTLGELEGPLAQLFPPPASGPGQTPVWSDRHIAGVNARQLTLAPGLQLDYAVFNRLVVVSTSLQGIGEVAARTHSLTADPSYTATLGNRPDRVTSLLFLDFSQLLNLGAQIGLTRSAVYSELQPALQKIQAVGSVSTRGEADTTAELFLQIP